MKEKRGNLKFQNIGVGGRSGYGSESISPPGANNAYSSRVPSRVCVERYLVLGQRGISMSDAATALAVLLREGERTRERERERGNVWLAGRRLTRSESESLAEAVSLICD